MTLKQLSIPDFVAETREIPLTQGKVAVVSATDYDWLMQWKWHAYLSGKNWYAARNLRPDSSGKRRTLAMHSAIIDAPLGYEIDHIDGNGLNNCRSNLRICLHSQNGRNLRIRQGKSSQYKGVCWNKEARKWICYITHNGKRLFLGYFHDEAEAALAYNAAAIQFFGEFARLNQINEVTE